MKELLMISDTQTLAICVTDLQKNRFTEKQLDLQEKLTKDQYVLLSLRSNLHPKNRKSPSGTEKKINLSKFGLSA